MEVCIVYETLYFVLLVASGSIKYPKDFSYLKRRSYVFQLKNSEKGGGGGACTPYFVCFLCPLSF